MTRNRATSDGCEPPVTVHIRGRERLDTKHLAEGGPDQGEMNRRHVFALALALLVVAAWGTVVTNGSAKQRALSHEEAYLQEELENAPCLDSYGTHETTDESRASVVGYQLDGRTVRVFQPYWYGTDDEEADSTSEAVYVVGGDTVYRVRGEPLDLPC